MQLNFWQIVGLIGGGVMLAVFCVVVGGWLIFKSRMAVPGERMFFGVPKGESFTIPDVMDSPDFPDQDAEKNVLKRTEDFLKILGGNR